MQNKVPEELKSNIQIMSNWIMFCAISLLILMFLFFLISIAKLAAGDGYFNRTYGATTNIITALLSMPANIILIIKATSYKTFLKTGDAADFNKAQKNQVIYWMISVIMLFTSIVLTILKQ